MTRRLEELRLLPRGTYEKLGRSGIRPRDLASSINAVPRKRPDMRLGLPERYVALAISAHDKELLSESELAEALATDIATARDVYQRGQSIVLDDGTQLDVDLKGADLRTA
jgi:hypothetical protein